ncbi:hypothetical protein [Bacillus smithii]|uniref:hypothetical protein n=1 Tax=Bacillus smithii TaxID=1479 RepID=UPI0030C98DCA
MTLEEIKPFLDKNVLVTLDTGQKFEGYLTNYVAELDDDDNLIENVDLMPKGESGYYYGFDLKQIKKLELL